MGTDSTWMGGRLGTPGAVGFLYMFVQIRISHSWIKKYILEYIARLKYVNLQRSSVCLQKLPFQKLSNIGAGYYLDGRPLGNAGCCWNFYILLKGKIFFVIHFSQVGRAVQGVRLKI